MKKQRETTPIKTLRDAYKVRGFRVLAKLDSYDLEPPVLVVALNRRAKKRCAAAAGKFAEASMVMPRINCFMLSLGSDAVRWCNSILDGMHRRRC